MQKATELRMQDELEIDCDQRDDYEDKSELEENEEEEAGRHNESEISQITDDLDAVDSEVELVNNMRSLSCLAHSLQLVIKDGLKETGVQNLLGKCRVVVRKICQSSDGTEKLIAKAHKSLIKDCPTRWNSTLFMVQRLLDVRAELKAVFTEMKWEEMIANSEWGRLEELTLLLELFGQHTNILQTDCMSLSLILPSLLDLECHFQNTTHYKTLARSLLASFHRLFARLLNPDAENFDIIPSVACYTDPTVANCLLTFKMSPLREEAKNFITRFSKQVVLVFY